jgi:thiol-disulfide isomerase/thioredoxin
MLVFAIAIAFNLPATLQRIVPDYTSALQDKVAGPDQIAAKLNLGGIVNDQNKQLSNCTNGGAKLESCGTAPDIKGITGWLNTPGNTPVDLKALRGKVVLVDFWAYSCINCQRAIPHVADWYNKYKDSGLEVIGVHSPEYAFEKVPGNVASGAADLGITYPIALDNTLSTWTNYRNRYWPAEYLIDAGGTVRHIKFGEGDYNVTENLIRQLLTDANPGVKLPPPSDSTDTTPQTGQTPETYFSVGKVAKRHIRPPRPLGVGLPGRHSRCRHVRHRAELQRQECLHRGRRRGHRHGDPGREDHDGTDQRPAHLPPDCGRRPGSTRATRSPSQQRTPGVLLHIRLDRTIGQPGCPAAGLPAHAPIAIGAGTPSDLDAGTDAFNLGNAKLSNYSQNYKGHHGADVRGGQRRHRRPANSRGRNPKRQNSYRAWS